MNYLEEDQKSQLIDSPFECNICLDIATEPILTTCGHLYCWTCIYSWLNSNQEFLTCPVCKNGCPKASLIPLYAKGSEETKSKKPRDPNIPPRPKPQRNEPVRNPQPMGGVNNLTNGAMLAGYGLFPSLFNLVLVKEGEIDLDPVHESMSLLKNIDESPIEHANYRHFRRILLLVLLGLIVLMFCYF